MKFTPLLLSFFVIAGLFVFYNLSVRSHNYALKCYNDGNDYECFDKNVDLVFKYNNSGKLRVKGLVNFDDHCVRIDKKINVDKFFNMAEINIARNQYFFKNMGMYESYTITDNNKLFNLRLMNTTYVFRICVTLLLFFVFMVLFY